MSEKENIERERAKKERKQNSVFTTYAKIIYMKIYVIFVVAVVVALAVKQHTIPPPCMPVIC